MIENMNAYSFTLDDEDMKQLSTRPQDMCLVRQPRSLVDALIFISKI
jgi:diketogulonate reductase-like aldo/keto reductase